MATRKEEENGSRCLHFLNRSVALHLEDNLSPTLLEQPKPLLRRRRLSGSCGAARSCCTMGNSQLKRVGAKDLLNIGDRICIPISVQELPAEKQELQEKQWHCAEEEVNFLRSLELYKDSAIIVINKPPGMPVQGGIGIKRSLDELAATCLRYDHSEPPQLVHRLDRDSSGILVMGRTRTSATVLHSIFREKPCGASKEDTDSKERILQRQYWALVIGSPRRPKGLVSASLSKVVVGDGKSERITVIDNVQSVPSQHAITEYRVIKSTSHSYTWLELSPLTGRKHQLRVHCAEVLGTPIVGDYKYGWEANRKWRHFPLFNFDKNSNENSPKENSLPFGLNLGSGSICEKHPRLHLHCKKMILPNVSKALQSLHSSDYNPSEMESLELAAPLPAFMQKSWDVLNS
ncbi:hypothetical protein SLEP1_g50510 [Rubroshorea leprosula]|uniref:Pseudouridine synthase RsuA/RluA-like domain-containing protein n=1 Tax=Rubroshorea leprosula TaxID=152421 RepID=A0AAV5M0I6_9ROSI|nr:hypothetical protein SLEP1_g50510 [Rubroshorea leprosula]